MDFALWEGARDSMDGISRRTALRHGAIATGALTALTGTAAAKKTKKKIPCPGLLKAAEEQEEIALRMAKQGKKKQAVHHSELARKLRKQWEECLSKPKRKKKKSTEQQELTQSIRGG